MRSTEWLLFPMIFSDSYIPKTTNFRHFVSHFISSKWVEIETSNLVDRLIVASSIHGEPSMKVA